MENSKEEPLKRQKEEVIEATSTENQYPIEDCIHTLRGVQIMLDKDLAQLYGVETKQLNRQVKRNIERFPRDFMFQLTAEEFRNMRCHFGTSSWGGTRTMPYAFTENGIAMLSGVLRSPAAIRTNIRIMRAFTTMRRFLAANNQIFQRLETVEYKQLEISKRQDKTDNQITEIFEKINKSTDFSKQGIFFEGQVFDAYIFVSNLIKEAKKSIVLIDNYVDDTVLTLLDKRKKNVSATIYSSKIDKQLKLDLAKHNAQYPKIILEEYTLSHDRFLCIDETVYHIGASIKDLGKKWFAFSKIELVTSAEIIERINR